MAYSLVIVDDEQVSRDGLTSLIDWQSLGFEVSASFADGSGAIEFLSENSVEVVLTDIKMKVVSGIELSAWLREHRPDVKIVLISAHRKFDYAKEAIHHGVSAYILKPFPLSEIDQVFSTIRRELDEIVKHEDGGPGGDVAGEERIEHVKDVVRARLASKITLKEIADELCLAPGYISRLFSQESGETISSFIARSRVERAQELLRDSRLRVYEICEQVGYRDLRHFYEVFKRYSGTTPSEYRRAARRER